MTRIEAEAKWLQNQSKYSEQCMMTMIAVKIVMSMITVMIIMTSVFVVVCARSATTVKNACQAGLQNAHMDRMPVGRIQQ